MRTYSPGVWLLGTGGLVLLASLFALGMYRVVKQELDFAKEYRHPPGLAVAPDGDEVFYDVKLNGVPVIVSNSTRNWSNACRVVEIDARRPFLSNDGKHLYFHRGADNHFDFTEVWRKELDSQKCELVISAAAVKLPSASLESISPDGSLLVIRYPDYKAGVGKCKIFRSDGASLEHIPPCDDAWFCGEAILTNRLGKLQLEELDGKVEKIRWDSLDLASISHDGCIALGKVSGDANHYRLVRFKEGDIIADIQADFAFLSNDGMLAVYRNNGALNGESTVFSVQQGKSISLGRRGEPTPWISSPGGLGYRNERMIYLFEAKANTLQRYPVRTPIISGVKKQS